MKRIIKVNNPEKLSSYWLCQWKLSILIIISGIAFDGSMSIGPVLQGKLLDGIIDGIGLNEIIIRAVQFTSVILVIQLMRLLKRYFVRLFANRTSASMRMHIYRNVMSEKLQDLTQENAGEMMTRTVSDVDICAEGMRKVTTEIFDTGVILISYFIAMSAYDVWLSLIALACLPPAVLFAKFMKKTIVRTTAAARTANSHLTGITYDYVSNAVLYRINSMEEANLVSYQKQLSELEQKQVKGGILENSMQTIYSIIASVGIIAVIYIGGKKVIDEVWTVGDFTAYITLFTAVTVKAGKTSKLFTSFQKAMVSWNRIKPYFTEKPEEHKLNNTVDYMQKGAKKEGMAQVRANSEEITENSIYKSTAEKLSLEVNHLRFRYPDTDRYIVNDVSFTARPGEIVGVTGAIACGKTSLLTSLLGIYEYEGSIRLCGRELKDYKEPDRSGMISFMGHDPELLSDTIDRNIALGDDGDIIEVLQDVSFIKDLDGMTAGTNTCVGSSGVRLSGGQQARLALARALYRRSNNTGRLVLLDDPFSAVDLQTETEIMRCIRNKYSKDIIILVSHRILSFSNIDSVIFMHHDGTGCQAEHEQMLEKEPEYRQLYEISAGRGSEHEI